MLDETKVEENENATEEAAKTESKVSGSLQTVVKTLSDNANASDSIGAVIKSIADTSKDILDRVEPAAEQLRINIKEKTGVEFAPLFIPRKRRLQTAAVFF